MKTNKWWFWGGVACLAAFGVWAQPVTAVTAPPGVTSMRATALDDVPQGGSNTAVIGVQSVPSSPAPKAQAQGGGTEDGGASASSAPPAVGVADAADGRTRDSQFQRFVQEVTGQRLPRFGERFFAGPTTFAPLDRVPVPADYVLGPGDELLIRVWGALDIDYRAVVDRNGLVSIPRVGTVRVAGIKAGEVERYLAGQVGKVFRNFELNVTLGQLRSIQVFVVGHARRPGSYTVSSLSTLLNAVLASGGPSESGSMRRIQLRRAEKVVTELDLYQFLLRGDKSADVALLPGDTIVYLPAGPLVALIGATDAPAVYELKGEGEPLRQLLEYAGGLTPVTAGHRAHVERVDPRRPRDPRQVEILELNGPGLGYVIRNGDVVTLFPVAPDFANAVTLRGNVAGPLRYPYTPGMRVSDLIPDREALLTADYYRRKNRLVQYLGEAPATTQTTRALVDEPNWEYAVIERLNRDNLTVQLIPFHLGRAVIERDPRDDLLLQPGDVVTIYGRRELRSPQATSTRVVRVEGEVVRPGVYQIQPGETLRSVLHRAGGLTPQAYVFGLEFSRESTRQKQREAIAEAVRRLESTLAAETAQQMANLSNTDAAAAARLQASFVEARRAQLQRLRTLEPNGRIALGLNPESRAIEDLPDVPLEDGDRVLVPARPGFVFAAGAVANSNALVWREGQRVSDYLRMAGLESSADEENIFVVRADGSVVHQRDGGWLFSRLGSMELAPGDVIVVPELVNRETKWTAFVRGLKDWTQILYQFGLAAAAIDTLRN